MKQGISDSGTLRQIAAIGIILLAAAVTAFLVIWDSVTGKPISPIADTLGGILIGFATHELGVSRGASLTQPTQLTQGAKDVSQ